MNKEAVSKKLGLIMGVLLTIALIGSFIGMLGYIVGMIVGGEFAESLCTFIYEKDFKTMFIVAFVGAMFGLAKMYINGEKDFYLDLSSVAQTKEEIEKSNAASEEKEASGEKEENKD